MRVMCVLIVGLFVFGFFASLGSAQEIKLEVKSQPATVTKYTTHAPIRINSDAEFTSLFSNRTIWGLEINGGDYGFCIYIGNCSQAFTVKNCYLHNACGKIYIDYFWNTACYIHKSFNGTIENNVCSMNTQNGIYLYESENNKVTNNTCNGNTLYGILLDYSNHNTLIDNNCSWNKIGISLKNSNTNTVRQNTMYGCGLIIEGTFLSYYGTHNIDSTNFVNNKPVYYLKNQTGITIPQGAGQVILINCSSVIVEHQTMTDCSLSIMMVYSLNCTLSRNNCSGNTMHGILLEVSKSSTIIDNTCNDNWMGIYLEDFSVHNTITGNNCNDSYRGIYLDSSDSNILAYNNCSGNFDYGFYLELSNYNRIHHNKFINNNGADSTYNPGYIQSYDGAGHNFWNESYPSGGNYWSDLTSPDIKSGPNQDQPGGDGIVDSPYVLEGGVMDHYPLTTTIVIPEPSPIPPIICSVLLLTALVARRRWWCI